MVECLLGADFLRSSTKGFERLRVAWRSTRILAKGASRLRWPEPAISSANISYGIIGSKSDMQTCIQQIHPKECAPVPFRLPSRGCRRCCCAAGERQRTRRANRASFPVARDKLPGWTKYHDSLKVRACLPGSRAHLSNTKESDNNACRHLLGPQKNLYIYRNSAWNTSAKRFTSASFYLLALVAVARFFVAQPRKCAPSGVLLGFVHLLSSCFFHSRRSTVPFFFSSVHIAS